MRIKIVVKWGTCSNRNGSTSKGEIREGFREEVTDRGMSRTSPGEMGLKGKCIWEEGRVCIKV